MKNRILFLFILAIVLPANLFAQMDTSESITGIKLIKPVSVTLNNFSGDELHLTVGQKAEQPIRAQALWNDGSPIQNRQVVFFGNGSTP